MKQYVGIPFEHKSCWDLCRAVYEEQFGIQLPRIGEQPQVAFAILDGPVEGCLVRVQRIPPLAEHWGVYAAGYVLHAQMPASIMVPLGRFMQAHADVQFFRVMPL